MIYQPREDSYLLEKEVKKYSKGKKVLDMGCGEGIQSLAALNSGAREVLAVDTDKEAVAFARKKGINAIQSDLFSNIRIYKKSKKFDLIIFNPPYLPRDKREDAESALATTGGRHGDEIILKFLKQASNFLAKDGIILIVVSSLTPLVRIKKILHKNQMKNKVISSEKMFMETLELWKIWN